MVDLNPKIAELVGMHVGDGTLYKTEYNLVWELRGSLTEKDYYIYHVALLLKDLFKIEFSPKFRSGGKNGCFGIQTSKKAVTSFFLQLGFLAGKKSHTVIIPEYIKKSENNIKLAFIRGYFDTDGCLRFEKINNGKVYSYPKIEFCTVSRQLREDLFSLLIELGFKPYKWGKDTFKICLPGTKNLQKFITDVAPKNKKHLNKYVFWKKNGYCNPHAAIA